jgi:cytoskeletal protein CcmA (bactofilin family)
MWKSSLDGATPVCPVPQLARPLPAIPPLRPVVHKAASTLDESHIGKGLILKGKISGTQPLFIDGSVEGSISLPNSLVTVGANGQVTASIAASDVLVLGKVFGNIVAANRIDIRAEGSVTGDMIAARMSIEDGAFIKGRVSIEKVAAEPAVAMAPVRDALGVPGTRTHAQPEGGQLHMNAVMESV